MSVRLGITMNSLRDQRDAPMEVWRGHGWQRHLVLVTMQSKHVRRSSVRAWHLRNTDSTARMIEKHNFVAGADYQVFTGRVMRLSSR